MLEAVECQALTKTNLGFRSWKNVGYCPSDKVSTPAELRALGMLLWGWLLGLSAWCAKIIGANQDLSWQDITGKYCQHSTV